MIRITARTMCALLSILAATLNAQAPLSRVSGIVYDSIGGAPLAGAGVQFFGRRVPVDGRMFTTTTDSLGRFQIDTLPRGEYVVGFFHRAMDTLGIDVKSRVVRVASDRQRVDLASPSPYEMITAFCGAESLRDSTALLIGHVRSADDERAIIGASVLLDWVETSLERGIGARTVDRSAHTQTIADGWFAICGVPAGFPLLTRAAFGSDTTGYVEHASRAQAVEHVTFLIGHARRVALVDSLSGDSASTTRDTIRVLRGTARLVGRVLTERGVPPAMAHVDFPGTGIQATTSNTGRFTMDSLPSGTHSVLLRAIGFTPVEHVIHLAEGRETVAELRFPQQAVVLGAVEVKAELLFSRKLQVFEAHRRRSVGGLFFRPGPGTPYEYAELRIFPMQAMNTQVRNVYGQWTVSMHTRRGDCIPSLWLDGARFRLGFDALNWMVPPGEILGVEIYTSALGVPAEFSEPGAGCGAIAVWRQPPPAKVKPRLP